MDAARLAFRERTFDVVVCVQNGICASRIDPRSLMRETMRALRPGGLAMFSSYAERFWPERLRWFEAQAAEGLVGKIDRKRTGGGVIVCEDGFRAETFRPADFRALCAEFGLEPRITIVDASSVFCEVRRPA